MPKIYLKFLNIEIFKKTIENIEVGIEADSSWCSFLSLEDTRHLSLIVTLFTLHLDLLIHPAHPGHTSAN